MSSEWPASSLSSGDEQWNLWILSSFRVVVLNPGCTLKLSGEFLKDTFAGISPRSN